MIKEQICNLGFLSLVTLLLFSLTACGYDSPTHVTTKKLEVVESTHNIEFETKELDDDILNGIAQHYVYNGNGTVDITVSYNPSDRNNSAMKASDEASRIARYLQKNGVKDLKTGILPVHKSEVSKTYFSYTSYNARVPEGCYNMEDIDDSEHRNFADYTLGCSAMEYVANQISKPKDLLGMNEITEETAARKRSNVIESDKWTISNESLQGDRASEL